MQIENNNAKPSYYDIKGAARECGIKPHDMLLLAHAEKLPLGIHVRNAKVLFLRDGKNPNMNVEAKHAIISKTKATNVSLHRAYDGAKDFNGILYLKHRNISELLKNLFKVFLMCYSALCSPLPERNYAQLSERYYSRTV